MIIPKMISLSEAEQITGLSYEFLRQRCLDNTLVHIRSGRKIYINSEKLAAYLNGEETERREAKDYAV